MASQAETLSLVAQVVDKYSNPLRDMRRQLAALGLTGQGVHKDGSRQAVTHTHAFQDLRKSMRETSDHMQNIFKPAMVGLGLSAIGTGAAITGVTKSIKDFAGFSREMGFLSKETGLSINRLNAYREAGARVNITNQAMDQGLKQINESLSQFEKFRDSDLQQFFAVNPGLAKLRDDLRAHKGDREAQNKILQDSYAGLKEADQHLLEEKFGGANFRRLRSDAVDEAQKKQHQFTEQQIADGKALINSFDDIGAAAQKFKDEVGVSLTQPMKEASEAVRAFLDDHGDDMRKFLSEVATDLSSADWKGFAEGIGTAATEAKKLIDTFGGVNTLEALAALKFGGAAGLAGFLAYSAAAPGKTNETETEVERQKRLGVPQPFTYPLDAKKELVLPQEAKPGWPKLLRDRPIWEDEHPIKGSAADIRGLAAARGGKGAETPGAEIRQEGVITRATMRGTMEGSRQGFLAAFKEWENEKKRLAGGGSGGGGIQNASYETGEPGGAGTGLGGGRGGRGGGSGRGSGGETPALTPEAKRAAATHAGQRALFTGQVKEHAAVLKAAAAGLDDTYKGPYTGPGANLRNKGGPALGDRYRLSMKVAEDELRKQGMPADKIRGAASIIVGNASAESELIPQTRHEAGGTGYGIYGADPARQRQMFKWLAEHGYDRDSLVGQVRQMVVASKTHKTRRGDSWQALQNPNLGYSGPGSYEDIFESPARNNNRAAQIREAFRSHPDAPKIDPNVKRDYSKIIPHDRTGPGEGSHAQHLGDFAHFRKSLGLDKEAASAKWPSKEEADRIRAAGVGARAEGGPVWKGQPFTVGEKGPELFVPKTAGEIIPNKGVNLGNIRAKGGGFRHFADEFQAAHAIVNQVQKYAKWFKAETIPSILKHYSPAGENPTPRLIKNMLERTGLGAGKLDFSNPETAAKFAHGIAIQEVSSKIPLEKFQEFFSHRGIQRHAFGHPHRDLLGNARKAGLLEQPAHKVTGEASMRIDLRGFPKGTKTQTSMSGMFSKIRVARGRAMPLADTEG